ncbi:unnamed protein product [Aspergillus oryzae]|uniref:Unnamed protein product n=1 Tax=Aspergillus oryzae var. brunneus TaxID=332754 RepID=A0ABQ6KPI3_ASPOZ|nr:unnamed protein product [Aspergillus oryzae]GMF90929.1 unnamed protein product [Aspergillus oryzae]GMG09539.1 unnamed protein product [Aspergillus oryzae]GMG46584.1 unnamed protein product [Aspergillus oryzae var. brunneus]
MTRQLTSGARLQGKVAIVTGIFLSYNSWRGMHIANDEPGGGSGFGAAIARRFGEEGAKVIITDINVEGGQKVAAQNPESLVFQQMDVTKADDWTAVMDLAFSKFGRLDILVNNAGITYRNKATKGLAAEYGPHNIRVNTVSPLLSGTGLFSMFTGMPDTPENREKFIGNVPLGRLTDPDDVANMCLYLASDEGSFINGAEMIVDGGKCI